MPSIITSSVTEKCLRDLLSEQGYKLSPFRKIGETGVDIEAIKGSIHIHIEVIAHKSSGPARSKDFFQAFFRAISRIKDGAKQCVIALPSRAKKGLPLRARQYGVAWERIGNAFPELQIWLVDSDTHECEHSLWNDWLKRGKQLPKKEGTNGRFSRNLGKLQQISHS